MTLAPYNALRLWGSELLLWLDHPYGDDSIVWRIEALGWAVTVGLHPHRLRPWEVRLEGHDGRISIASLGADLERLANNVLDEWGEWLGWLDGMSGADGPESVSAQVEMQF